MPISRTQTLLLSAGLALLVFPTVSEAQAPSSKASNSSIKWLTPIEVIRNIDQLLAESRLEALEAGRGDAFAAKINMAKSFVHAGDYEEAKKIYAEALAIAWKRQVSNDIMMRVENELDRSNKSLMMASRPAGLDENYQPISDESVHISQKAVSIDKYEAGKKIDQALSFIYASILEQKDQQLTLQGKLNFCRHLIELEEYETAKKEYHKTIINYLDPRWTSQLLEEIDAIISTIHPSQTYSEQHPEATLTAERALLEIQEITKPIEKYYAGNALLSNGVRSMHSLIRKGEHEMVLAEMQKTFIDFAPASWVENSVFRTKKILERVEGYRNQSYEDKMIGTAPILYSKTIAEGRETETIRIIEDNALVTYKRVTHSWGGVYNFINDESAKDTEWIRVWKLYQDQEF